MADGIARLDTGPAAGAPAATAVPAARWRWTAGGLVHQLPLGPVPEGPQLVGAGAAAQDLLLALLGALDRAARTGEPRVRQRQGEVEVFLDVPESWPRPTGSLAAILTGPSRWAPCPPAGETEALRLHARALAALGPDELALLRAYPRRRRAIAVWRRRLESTQWQLDERLRGARRAALAMRVGTLLAVTGALTAAHLEQPELVLAAGGLTLALGAASAIALRRVARLAARRAGRAERLGRLALRHEDLERRAHAAASRLGVEDPWGLTSRLEQAEARRRDIEEQLAPSFDTLAWAEKVAVAIGIVPPGPFTPPSVQLGGPEEAAGWPYEVAAAEAGSELRAAAALARVAERVARELPAPWPVVLFEPWAADPPESRARRLMALARVLPERAVIAIVSHR